MDRSYITTPAVTSREQSEPIKFHCQSLEQTYNDNWHELEEYWGAEKYRLQLEVQLQTLSSSLEHQLLFEDYLEKPSEAKKTENKTKEPNYVHLTDSSYIVRGEDICDIPSSYVIKGLEDYEIPVIGTYVDKKVVPGFRYRVRLNQTKKYLFNGEPLTLVSVGMGYGKRLVFEDKNAGSKDNYFWSDTYSEGYGFTIEAISEGDIFDIRQSDNGPSLGTAKIVECRDDQQELSTNITENGTIEKIVRVNIWCSVSSSLCQGANYSAVGEVLLSKPKRSTSAKVVRVVLKNFILTNCCLYPLTA